MNQLETNCRKSLIPFHAIWGLCWYNISLHRECVLQQSLLRIRIHAKPKKGQQNGERIKRKKKTVTKAAESLEGQMVMWQYAGTAPVA